MDYFDTVVAEWYANGGKVLTEREENGFERGKNKKKWGLIRR